MADEVLSRDQNHIVVLGGITDDSAQEIRMFRIDPVTKRLLISATGLGSGTVTDFIFTNANGISGVVATSTTTPTLTLSLGAITPTSVNGLTISTTTGTFTLTNGKTLTVLKTMSLTAADDTGVYTFPTGTKTLVATDVTALTSLAQVGTITVGVWNATDVPVSAGGTGLSTISALSIWVANSANVITEVTPGAGQSIRINGAGNAWEAFTPSSSVPTTITVANEATDTTCFIAFFTAATGDLGPKTNANMTFDSSTGIATFASTVLTTTDINGGTIDGTAIGGSSASTGVFTTVNGMTITSSTGTFTLTNAKTFAVTNTLTLSGTDSTIMTFPSTSATIARTDAGQTFTGVNTFTSPSITTSITTVSTTFTAFAGATTLLTIGGTGATAVFAIPGTLEQSSTTGALTVAGGVYIAKKLLVAGIASFTSPDITTSITTTSVSFTAFAGATTLLTIGGTGASASLFAPSTLDTTSSITGAIRTSGGISAAKAIWVGTDANIGTAGAATGTIKISGSTSGTITIKPNNTAGTWTLELPANDGDAGQFLQTNGSGVTSWAAATVTASPNVKFSTMFEASGRWSTNHASGTATFNQNGVSLDTTSTGSRRAQIYMSNTVPGASQKPFDESPSFSCSAYLQTIGTTGYTACGVGDTSGGTATTTRHISFFIETAAGTTNLYASNANGTTQTKSASLTTLVATDVVDLYWKKTSTTSIDFYWRKNGGAWSSATQHTTNLPSGTSGDYFDFNVSNTTGQFVTIVQSANYER